MLFARMMDQTEKLMGVEVSQAIAGYPHVLMRNGSKVDMDGALKETHQQYMKLKAYRQWSQRHELEEDAEWRSRVEAYNLLCDRKRCPELGHFTSSNMDKCIDMLTDDIPWDTDNATLDDEGKWLSMTPRIGTFLPQWYKWTPELDYNCCLLDFETPGPEQLLPILLEVLCIDCRTDRKLCIFQIRSGEHIKVWVTLDDGQRVRKIYPQLDALLERNRSTTQLAKRVVETERRDGHLHTRVCFVEPPLPKPEKVTPVTCNPLLTNASVCDMLRGNGRVTDYATARALMPPASPEVKDEQRTELKASILESKAEECLHLLSIVSRRHGTNEPLLKPAMSELRKFHVQALEEHTAKLLRRVSSTPLPCKPRPLPDCEAATVEELESYAECNALHRRIAELYAARDGRDGAPNLENMGMEQLEQHWKEVTE
jgi:hypothetical protein